MSSSRWPVWSNQEIVLYHGTLQRHAQDIVARGVKTFNGRPNTDFGRGFYTTTLLSQATAWAEQTGTEQNEDFTVVRLTVARLALSRLRSLTFIRGDIDALDFWSFVAHCRRGRQRVPLTDEHYDVVYGPVARTWGGVHDSEIIPRFDQISFHGQRGEDLLRDNRLCKVERIP